MKNKLVQTKYGYYTYEPKPSTEELQKHYADKYYQASGDYSSGSTYSTSYPLDEIRHRNFIADLVVHRAKQLRPNAKIAFDLGCGEGFLLNSFHNKLITCYGMDFSNFAISQCNPNLLEYFEQGDVLDFNIKEIDPQVIDIVSCMNVLEHVRDPECLLEKLKTSFRKETLFVVKVPNDFSFLQQYLLKRGDISSEFWLSYPEHLSYFNKDSFLAVAEDFKFKVHSVLADFSIDLLLLADTLNYAKDPTKGPQAHQYRVQTDLFLSNHSYDDIIKLYEAYGNLGIGRDLTYFMEMKS